MSFVDCPGHDILMATMLNGAAVMDAALLLVTSTSLFPMYYASLPDIIYTYFLYIFVLPLFCFPLFLHLGVEYLGGRK